MRPANRPRLTLQSRIGVQQFQAEDPRCLRQDRKARHRGRALQREWLAPRQDKRDPSATRSPAVRPPGTTLPSISGHIRAAACSGASLRVSQAAGRTRVGRGRGQVLSCIRRGAVPRPVARIALPLQSEWPALPRGFGTPPAALAVVKPVEKPNSMVRTFDLLRYLSNQYALRYSPLRAKGHLGSCAMQIEIRDVRSSPCLVR